MWKSALLVLPVLVPSWRFFKSIEPSPRVQWTLLPDPNAQPRQWLDLNPSAPALSLRSMVMRLFWNPHWNDALFVVSCAERINQQPTEHSVSEIRLRILRELHTTSQDIAGKFIQFRLVFVRREGAELQREIVFISDVAPVERPDT